MIHLAPPRLRPLPAALGFAFAALVAAPAAADCSAGPMTASTGPGGANYTCTRNCVATTARRVLGTRTFSGHGVTRSQCLSACNATPGCTAASYVINTTTRDGVPYSEMTCTLYGAGDVTTMDQPPTTPGRSTGVCYRDAPPSILDYPGLQIDTRVRPETFRHNGLPKFNFNPNKP